MSVTPEAVAPPAALHSRDKQDDLLRAAIQYGAMEAGDRATEDLRSASEHRGKVNFLLTRMERA
jgi:hypothetical protein